MTDTTENRASCQKCGKGPVYHADPAVDHGMVWPVSGNGDSGGRGAELAEQMEKRLNEGECWACIDRKAGKCWLCGRVV